MVKFPMTMSYESKNSRIKWTVSIIISYLMFLICLCSIRQKYGNILLFVYALSVLAICAYFGLLIKIKKKRLS